MPPQRDIEVSAVRQQRQLAVGINFALDCQQTLALSYINHDVANGDQPALGHINDALAHDIRQALAVEAKLSHLRLQVGSHLLSRTFQRYGQINISQGAQSQSTQPLCNLAAA